MAVPVHSARVHEAHFRYARHQRGQRRLGARSLKGKKRTISDRGHGATGKIGRKVRDVLFLRCRVHNQQQIVAPVGDHQVIKDAARLAGKEPVSLPPLGNSEDGNRHKRLKGQLGLFERVSGNPDLTHMAYVEKPRRCPGMQVFPEHAVIVLHRHLVASKRHHPGVKIGVKFVQRCPVQVRHRGSPQSARANRRAPPGQSHCPSRAPSVLLPEIVIPSAPRARGLSRSISTRRSFGLRVYRGGCSFGTGSHPDSPVASP